MVRVVFCWLAFPVLRANVAIAQDRPGRPYNGVLVTGRTVTSAGAPVAGAELLVRVLDADFPAGDLRQRIGQCEGALIHREFTGTTEADGSFRLPLRITPGPDFCACIVIDATPPAGSGLSAVQHSGLRVLATRPFDSTFVEVVLPSPARF